MAGFELYDRVRLRKDLPEMPAGTEGIVLAFHKHGDRDTYSVAFRRGSRVDIDGEDLEPVARSTPSAGHHERD